jgi:hypothetical protein
LRRLRIRVPQACGDRKRQPRIILKTDERNIRLELGHDGKFAAKSTGWDEQPGFPRGDKLEAAVTNSRWVLTHLLAAPRKPEPVRHSSGRLVAPQQPACNGVALRRNKRCAITDRRRDRQRCR